MKISVITPSLNSARFIRQTIESVLSQKGNFDLEYIIRDGQSTDGTLSILQEYSNRCSIISEKDGSPQAAINAGMAQATGDVLAWLNADDEYEPGALQRVADVFLMHPACVWVYGRDKLVNENGRVIRKPITWYKNILGWRYSRNVLLCENFVPQTATFFRRESWQKVGGLSLQYKAAFDYDLWLRLAELGPALPIHSYLSRYRRHGATISEKNIALQFTEEIAIALPYGNVFHHTLHRLTSMITIAVYRLLSAHTGRKHQ